MHPVIQFKTGGGAIAWNGKYNDSPGWMTLDVDTVSYKTQAYYIGAIEDIHQAYQDQACSCYERWLIDQNDWKLLDCLETAETTAGDSFSEALSRFNIRCVSYCCVGPK